MKYPMLLQAPLKEYIWGGDKLKCEYGKKSALSVIAESWELSTHQNGESMVENGAFSGQALSAVLEKNPDFLGLNAEKYEKFPLLIKLIDANDKLSIQVHPNDSFAKEYENGEYGKTEVWYIVDAKEGAELIYGFKRDITKDEFETSIKENHFTDILNFVPVKKGDVFFIPAGLVHAICEGIFICEIQQNSDTTYRVYDWGRVGADGQPRPLHIDKAMAVSKLEGEKNSDFSLHLENIGNNRVGVICECDYFKAYKYDVVNELALNADEYSFHAITFLDGCSSLSLLGQSVSCKKGQTYFIPAGSGEYCIKGTCECIVSKV